MVFKNNMSAHKMFNDSDKVRVISASLHGGALLGRIGTIVFWDTSSDTWIGGSSENPFPERLRIEFESGFRCWLHKDTVTPV
jgi:hypothetical protein